MLRVIRRNPDGIGTILNMFGDFVNNSLSEEIKSENQDFCAMPLDLTETEKDYRVVANLPGIKKEDVKISLEKAQLIIEAENKNNVEDEKAVYHHKERFCGKYQRVIYLPENVNVDNIKAKMENGLLELIIPKEEIKPQKLINIE
ncbi:MAG: Hsp20/alpha crystallin family protein [Candidatus Cloacimonetes bacterium]|jgi:HSP20 family protein|nr:Hsp20/alpha crystallin family protein [Candidatus Cloacimonadota bacterium]